MRRDPVKQARPFPSAKHSGYVHTMLDSSSVRTETIPDSRASVHTYAENDDFGAVSVTKLSCAAPISKVERHRSDRFCARLWCSVNRKRSRSRSDDYREIKIHVYAKRQREFVPREQVFPLFSVYSLLLLRKNK